jgi:hypothetical protein
VPAAAACSLRSASDPASVSVESGPMPLIVSSIPELVLTRNDGQEVALVPFQPDEALVGAKTAYGEALHFFKPAQPLAQDTYFTNDFFIPSFEVTTSSVTSSEAKEVSADLALYIRDESTGLNLFEGFAGCGDHSTLTISLLHAKEDIQPLDGFVLSFTNYLVQFSAEDGTQFSRFVRASSLSPELLFYDNFDEVGGLASQALCIQIAEVTQEGTVGPHSDLGCVDPNDINDSRAVNPNLSAVGCSASSNPKSVPVMLIFTFIFGAVRLGRHRLS